jgi:hypothetical protein
MKAIGWLMTQLLLPRNAPERRPESEPVSERHALVLEEARRGIEHQQKDVNAIRDRAGHLLQFAALAAGFIGALSLRPGAELTEWTHRAVWAFVVLTVLLLWVLLPRKFTFTNDPLVLLDEEGWDLEPNDLAEQMARALAKHADRNQKKINWMMYGYIAAIVALLAEVYFLLMDLMGR